MQDLFPVIVAVGLGLLFVFMAGIYYQDGRRLVSVIVLAGGLLMLGGQAVAFLAHLGPLLK